MTRPEIKVGDRVRIRVKPIESRGSSYRVNEIAWSEKVYRVASVERFFRSILDFEAIILTCFTCRGGSASSRRTAPPCGLEAHAHARTRARARPLAPAGPHPHPHPHTCTDTSRSPTSFQANDGSTQANRARWSACSADRASMSLFVLPSERGDLPLTFAAFCSSASSCARAPGIPSFLFAMDVDYDEEVPEAGRAEEL